jgi:hypothetical protein
MFVSETKENGSKEHKKRKISWRRLIRHVDGAVDKFSSQFE